MRPSSSNTTAKEARGEGRLEPSMEAKIHVKVDCVVSRIQMVLKGTS